MENSMHPQDIRKVKALVWYWLNRHPAEVYRSATEIEDQGFIEDNIVYDMTVENARTGWKVGAGVSERYFFYQDPDRWHDINKTIVDWYADLWRVERKFALDYLMKVKGEPIDRWKFKYTKLPAPDWKSLVERFISQGYL